MVRNIYEAECCVTSGKKQSEYLRKKYGDHFIGEIIKLGAKGRWKEGGKIRIIMRRRREQSWWMPYGGG